ncbi:MAG: metal-dependent transcriptional regulator [Spirochaetota bacterium]
MPSHIVEDYLKRIFLEQEKLEADSPVSMGAVAESMGVTPGTATAMIQNLAEEGLVEYRKRNGSRLTQRGEEEALLIVRRHRLIEVFLQKSLGLDWAEVHEEADRLEHAVSEKVLERLEDFLGFPTVDPHGDPIPNAVGGLDRRRRLRLTEAPQKTRLRIIRVLDQSPAFLRFAESRGLQPEKVVIIIEDGAISGAVSVKSEGGEVSAIGLDAARNILVEPTD